MVRRFLAGVINFCGGKQSPGLREVPKRVIYGVPVDDPAWWYELGLRQEKGCALGEALYSFARAIELDPSHAGANEAWKRVAMHYPGAYSPHTNTWPQVASFQPR